MSIGKFNSSFYPSVPFRSPVQKTSIQTLDDAKQRLAEVLGSNRPDTIKLGDIPSKEKPDNVIGFERPLDQFVNWVDEKQHTVQSTTFNVLSGKTDNLHQSMLAIQEAGVAFTLLLEVRNKLVEGFKELTRMSI